MIFRIQFLSVNDFFLIKHSMEIDFFIETTLTYSFFSLFKVEVNDLHGDFEILMVEVFILFCLSGVYSCFYTLIGFGSP
jgi:hypothetical protein